MKLVVFILGWMIPLTCFSLPEKTISTDDLRQGPVALNGLWAFDWQALHIEMNRPMQDGLKLPGLWHEQGPYAPHGFATFRLRLHMPVQQPYYLRIPDMPSAMSLWVNGKLRFQRGVVSHTVQSEQPKFGPAVMPLEPATQYDLVLHVSNFHHKEGGVWHNLLISDAKHRAALRDQSKLLDAMVFSFLVLVSIYLLGRNITRYGHDSHIFFALFVWAIALRSVTVGERIAYDFISFMSWQNWQRLEHILLFIALPLFVYFFHRFFDIKNQVFPRIIAVVSFVVVIATVFLPATVFTWFGEVNQIMGLMTVAYIMIMLVLLRKQNAPFVNLFMISFMGWTVFVIHDYLYTHLYIQSRPLAQFGLVFFVLFQLYMLWLHSQRESRLLLSVKSSIDRSAGQIMKRYTQSNTTSLFTLRHWQASIDFYTGILNLPVYIEDDSILLNCSQDDLQSIVLILTRMADRDGISASLYIGNDSKNVNFEVILNKVTNQQKILHDELNAVHYALNTMGSKLDITRLSSSTKMSFSIPRYIEDEHEENDEKKVENLGNALAEPVLVNQDSTGVIGHTLSEYFHLILANITQENIIKFRPKMIVWQVKKWDAYMIEDIKRIRSEHNDIPILLLVDAYHKTQLAQCIRMGVTDYVVSPVLPEELLLKVQRLNSSSMVMLPENEDVRDVTVQLIRDAIDMWQRYSGKSKTVLAEKSGLWRVYMDGSTAKTRTLDKYLSVQTLPKNPRWETVNRTVHFVLDQCALDDKDEKKLNHQLSVFNRLLAN